MPVLIWRKRELENYFCTPEVLIRWAESKAATLFTSHYPEIINKCISDFTAPQFVRDRKNVWWNDEKLGDWAENIFREFYKRIHQPLLMRKSNFHELIYLLKKNEIDAEIK